MSDWPLAIGVLGTLTMLFYFCAGDRLAGAAGGRMPWGMLGFVVSQMVQEGVWVFPGTTPSWYGPSTYAACAVSGAVSLVRLAPGGHQQRANPENDPTGAAERAGRGRERLREYAASDDLAVLDLAVDDLRTAVGKSVGHGPHPGYVTELVRALRMRYERLGRIQDLDETVRAGERTDAARGGRAVRGRLHSQLGAALRLRYDHLGAADDLARAVAAGREAVRLVPPRSPYHPGACGHLGAALHSDFLHTDDLAVLEEAVAQVSAAVEWADGRGYRRAADRATLCHLLVQRGRRTGSPVDLDRAVKLGREALESTAPGEALYATSLSNLGLALRTRDAMGADGTGPRTPADLDEAIGLSERALATVPADAPERAVFQVVAALALRDRARYDTDRAPEGSGAGRLGQALDAAREAAEHVRADVPTRLRAGLLWSDIAASAGRYGDATAAFETVIALLPRLAGRELRRADQEDRLGRYTGIAADAAACALAEGATERAVALLEQGRGVLLSRELDLRADIRELRARDPRLASAFEELRAALAGAPGERSPSAPDTGDPRSRRREQGERWDALLREIRALDGLAEFAGPPSPERLVAGAAEGAVVYLNVSRYRSDAVLITPDGIRSVPLRVTPEDAGHRQRALDAALAPRRATGEQERAAAVHEVLGWLWDTVAEPVLDALKDLHAAHEGPGPPRVWWVPTGSLALLPVHAAGHRDGSRALLDRVISSYTPTVRSLTTARAAPAGPAGPRAPLAVTMSRTPGLGPLAGAEAEARMVSRLFPGTVRLTDEEATRERVLRELPRHAWAHFACHAVADRDVPSRGGLLLHDHHRRALTVEDVSALDLGRPELAYLSSCETARTAPRHADEAIHLATAFQLAGYRQVVATLWPVQDAVGSVFAERVYTELAGAVRSGAPVDAAAAVHRATLAVRALCPNRPQFWASYLHVGC
ncbi:CHAT domain-containing protein [Streptomyces sp. ITFR-16]|uniref:CHAT domain-containing protein n=1 Tax=Streptomyces sp. ITFR-16 TaxID=3075198 RepID=UPI00288C2DC6|nr:CHAT domain-containing protein [Streptomyces sp. ITFR-16]WNI21320.1 CHAT domain-containing protein [Streptomyces sp. ITFR-16]